VKTLSDKIDWEKATEYSEALEEYEKAKHKKAKLFDPKQLLTKTSKIRKAVDPELGIISYGTLVSEDLVEINKEQTNEEKGFVMLYIALRKAYPDVTLEDVKAFPLEDFTRLMKAIFGDQVFFPAPKPSQNGSKTPATFRGSGS
jgi:hypothetical protein